MYLASNLFKSLERKLGQQERGYSGNGQPPSSRTTSLATVAARCPSRAGQACVLVPWLGPLFLVIHIHPPQVKTQKIKRSQGPETWLPSRQVSVLSMRIHDLVA